MSHEAVFSLINLSVIPAWILLIVLPRSGATRRVVHSAFYPILLGVFYLGMMAWAIGGGMPGSSASFTSLAGVSAVFQSPVGVLIGWSHYLVFDLFIGAWIGRDSQRRGLPHLAVAPCQLLTFVLGPIGLLAYILLRMVLRQGAFGLSELDASPA